MPDAKLQNSRWGSPDTMSSRKGLCHLLYFWLTFSRLCFEKTLKTLAWKGSLSKYLGGSVLVYYFCLVHRIALDILGFLWKTGRERLLQKLIQSRWLRWVSNGGIANTGAYCGKVFVTRGNHVIRDSGESALLFSRHTNWIAIPNDKWIMSD